MATLYLRNVPEDVSGRLALLATREGMSVSAFAVRELAKASERAENEALLSGLPDLGMPPEAVVAEVEVGRAVR